METTKNKKQKTILDCELLGLHLERVEQKFHEMGIPEEDFVTNRLEDELEKLRPLLVRYQNDAERANHICNVLLYQGHRLL